MVSGRDFMDEEGQGRSAEVALQRLRWGSYVVAALGALLFVAVLGFYLGSWGEERFEFPPLVIVALGVAPYAALALAARFLPRTAWQAGVLLVGAALVSGYGAFVQMYSLERADLLIGFVVAGLSFLQLYAVGAVAALIAVMRCVSWLRQRRASR